MVKIFFQSVFIVENDKGTGDEKDKHEFNRMIYFKKETTLNLAC